jgi:hypothetical protein
VDRSRVCGTTVYGTRTRCRLFAHGSLGPVDHLTPVHANVSTNRTGTAP